MKVLLAIDDSDIAQKAFDWYFENVHKEGNEIIACHQSEQPNLPTVMFSGGAAFPAEEIGKIMTEHNKKMGDLENRYTMSLKNKKAQYKVIVETIEGKPGPGIVKTAEKHNVDLVVMGTRGLGLIKRTVLGSVSSHVVHHVKVPVLVCPM